MKWTISSAALLLPVVSAFAVPKENGGLKPRQIPANPTGLHTIKSPNGVQIRYKEPGKEGICETTPGVNSYSGYIDLSPTSHTFFWFFEARKDPANAPVTMWLNGGPGSDSLIGMFQELGPCNVTEELKTLLNPYSWSEYSNMLFLSQPVGTGFSYDTEIEGSIDPFTGSVLNSTQANVTGNWPMYNPEIDTTDLAAAATWEILQGFFDGLGQLDGQVKSSQFSLWTESYGGHYGTSFYNYFQKQNKLVVAGKQKGKVLNFDTLGIGNGIIDERIQAPYYPEFAVNNTYGIKAYNDSVYSYAKFAYNMIGGCQNQIDECREAYPLYASGALPFDTLCAEAADMCRDNVESPYYNYGGRGVYDIRHPIQDPTPPDLFPAFLNQAYVQNAIGVNLNYTDSNGDTYWAFQGTGDFIYREFIYDLAEIIDSGVRVVLYYGDADYICNWFGGQAISENVPYEHHKEFLAAGYAPFKVDGVEYGEVREYGNFSFLRIYEAGHEVPYYQPVAALEMFRRAILGLDMDSGLEKTTPTQGSKGSAKATHTEPYVALPPTSSASVAVSSTSTKTSKTATTSCATSAPTSVKRDVIGERRYGRKRDGSKIRR